MLPVLSLCPVSFDALSRNLIAYILFQFFPLFKTIFKILQLIFYLKLSGIFEKMQILQ